MIYTTLFFIILMILVIDELYEEMCLRRCQPSWDVLVYFRGLMLSLKVGILTKMG